MSGSQRFTFLMRLRSHGCGLANEVTCTPFDVTWQHATLTSTAVIHCQDRGNPRRSNRADAGSHSPTGGNARLRRAPPDLVHKPVLLPQREVVLFAFVYCSPGRPVSSSTRFGRQPSGGPMFEAFNLELDPLTKYSERSAPHSLTAAASEYGVNRGTSRLLERLPQRCL